MYTSGTTGRPKGATITYGMVDCLTSHCVAKVGLSTRSVSLTVLPMFHISGLNTYANPVIYMGGLNYVMRNFDARLCLDLIANPNTGAKSFHGGAHALSDDVRAAGIRGREVRHLESVISGGQAVPIPMVEMFAAKGMCLQQGWGMTEVCSLTLLLPREDVVRKRGSVGHPRHECRASNRRRRLQRCAGPVRSVNCWCEVRRFRRAICEIPGPTARSGLTNGFVPETPSVSDEDGYYYIVDRWKDMYISGGENVLSGRGRTGHCRARRGAGSGRGSAFPTSNGARSARAFILLRQGVAELPTSTVIAHCRSRLAGYKVPAEVVFVGDMPQYAGRQDHEARPAPRADRSASRLIKSGRTRSRDPPVSEGMATSLLSTCRSA